MSERGVFAASGMVSAEPGDVQLQPPLRVRVLDVSRKDNKLIFSEDIDLAAPNTDAIEALIGQYWQEIQSSGYQRIEYKNVSDWVQKKIEEKLDSGRFS